MRKDPVLAAGDEDDRVLETLGVVERHERHEALVVPARVRVGDQRDLGQEGIERVPSRLLGALERGRAGEGVELTCHPYELFEVLDPTLGLKGPFSRERLDVVRAGQDRLEQVADGRRSGTVRAAPPSCP